MSASMRVEMLGTMRVLVDGQPLPKTRSQKAKWLLALLALRGGKPIARSVAAGMLWPGTDATTALTNLRSVVSDLRRALGGQADRLQTPDRKTLSFDLKGVEVDALTFDDALRTRNLDRAVALYTGPLLQDCDEEWVGPERSLREQACLGACHELAEGADSPKAIALSQRAIELAPYQDGPRRDLMAAYVRSNDLNAALFAYREFARFLRSEIGGAPDPETTDLYLRIRAGLPSSEQREITLPHAFSSFVGRDDERVEIMQATRAHRLVTLTGIGGIGKTRLAREVAFDARAAYSDGVGFVPLEAIQGEAGLVHAVIAKLQIRPTPGVPPVRSLVEALRGKRHLLVLDNCEHLVPACARLANLLLMECPEVRILATSREPLCLPGERVLHLVGLTTPDPLHLPEQTTTLLRVLISYESVKLFVERAQTAAKGFELTRENAHAVAALCALLEGSPLAIELAAGRVRTMGVPDILERFRDHRLDFLEGNRHVGAARHQTLRATLDWSFSLLGAEERRLLARLAVFAGGWTMEAAEEVTGATPSLLESLVEKSLVVFSSNGRYGFLETVRQYAAERLEASGEAASIRKLHTDYYVVHAERLFAELATVETVERDLANFNEAMDRCENDPETDLRLVFALSKYWRRTFSVSEGRRRIEAALSKATPKPTPLRANVLHRLALLRAQDDRKEAIALHEESLGLWRELGDVLGTAQALHGLGLAALYAGEYRRAEALADECVSLLRNGPHQRPLALALNLVTLLCLRPGDYAQARVLANESLDLMRKNGGLGEVAGSLRTLGSVAYEISDYDSFRQCNEEALALYQSAGEEGGAAWCLGDLGKAYTDLGQVALGQDLLEEALETIRRVDDHYGVASILEYLGINAIARGDVEGARRFLMDSLEAFRALDHQFGIVRNLDALGDTSRREGNPNADSYYREALTIWRETGHRKRMRDGLIRIADGMNNFDRSVRLWACGHRLGEALGAPIPLTIRHGHEQAMQAAQGKPGFETSWAAGWEMPLDAALDLALTP